MALDKPKTPYDKTYRQNGILRYAGTLSGVDLDSCIAFQGENTHMVIGALRQLSYQGNTVYLSYIPLFADFIDGSDYPQTVLSQDDLVWTFDEPNLDEPNLDEVIALQVELKTRLSRTVSA